MRAKAPDYSSESVSGVVLYREDLEWIAQVLADRGLTVTISNSKAEFDDLDDVMRQLGTHPAELDITGEADDRSRGRVYVSINPRYAYVGWFPGTDAPMAAHQLVEFMRRCRVWRKQLSCTAWLWVEGIVVLTVNYLAIRTRHASLPFWPASIGVILTLGLIAFLASSHSLRTLNLTRRHEGGFWRRNWEKIALVVIGAIIGGVVTAVLTWIHGLARHP